jgi:hypothetical protein
VIDSFPFTGWFTAEGAVSEDITAFWPFAGDVAGESTTFASTGTLVMTIIGMIVTVLAIIGWIYKDDRMLTEHAERLRAAGFGRPGAPGPGGPVGRPEA